MDKGDPDDIVTDKDNNIAFVANGGKGTTVVDISDKKSHSISNLFW